MNKAAGPTSYRLGGPAACSFFRDPTRELDRRGEMGCGRLGRGVGALMRVSLLVMAVGCVRLLVFAVASGCGA